jgi:spectrin beta
MKLIKKLFSPQSGGKRATLRSWKTYYTVLSGQILCFFKDPNDFKESKAASPPILIHHAAVEKANDYTKKKYVIRLVTQDNSEFLFDAGSKEKCDAWTEKLLAIAMSDPGESVRQSILNQETSQHHIQQHHTQHHLQPSSVSPTPKKSPTLEPLYANVPPAASGDIESDTISELDSKEKRGGRLSKFLSRKHKVAN